MDLLALTTGAEAAFSELAVIGILIGGGVAGLGTILTGIGSLLS